MYREYTLSLNPLTPKPAITDHTTSILVGRISAGCCSEWGEKAIGGVVIKGPLGRDGRRKACRSHLPPPRRENEPERTNPFHRSISKQTSVYNCTQVLRYLSSRRVKYQIGELLEDKLTVANLSDDEEVIPPFFKDAMDSIEEL
ncbi:hypothetical protein AVEN_222585-1 [Araneus ventricosus]|uniref:Uncharacterized protein n=1 Tax=Araneus ventricosus TaxID=182803 RepID=A0A4Y1ZL51_ARAVE|nr:hypothetical protein AVEN_5486-1 [Araneus ventricosus]GBL56133.1 hypothetical protein AVEN_72048-1 [Araneus ventricosus]GBL56173.1 hypothetical protein AVEN_121815-1 [Araneus ventricosus]GBL56262.1 hypothetical protein AVEN_222585-1 [Araneus ventricosus]